jgi:hypothetical protein
MVNPELTMHSMDEAMQPHDVTPLGRQILQFAELNFTSVTIPPQDPEVFNNVY